MTYISAHSDREFQDDEPDDDICPCCTKGRVDPAYNYRNPGSPICGNCHGTGFTDPETIADALDQKIEDADDRLERAFASLSKTALAMKAENARFEAALCKIERWQKYRGTEHTPLTEYEEGANDAIDTLAAIAKEALDSADEPKF